MGREKIGTMKKSWKKWLCSLMLVPCAFLATACGDDPADDDKNKTLNLTVEQQQEAYTTLRTLASSVLNNDGTKDQAYTLYTSSEYRSVKNIDNAGLNAENLAVVQNSNNLSSSNKRVNTTYAGYKSNNTGYLYTSNRMYPNNNSSYYEETNIKRVIYNGINYQLYEDDNNSKIISKVDNLYAKNTIAASENISIFQNNTRKLSDILYVSEDEQDFNAFKSYIVNWTARTLAENKVENAYEQDFSQYVTTEYAFSVTDGIYSLTLDVDLDATNTAFRFLEDGNLTGDGTISISFDKNSIKKLEFNYDSRMTLQESSARVFGNNVNQEFDSDDYVLTTNSNLINLSIDFTTPFDNNFYNQTLTGYTGSGNNGAVESINVDATINFIYSDYMPITTKFRQGDNLQTSINSALASFLNENDLLVQFAWKIIDREMTQIGSEDTVPSIKFEVCIELTEEYREFVETPVTVYTAYDGYFDEIILNLYIDDNLYDNIEAVLGLSDEQIAGIYSDSELENKLSSDTLITENMVVYLVLND